MNSLSFKIESILNGHSMNALSKEREKLTQHYKGKRHASGLLPLRSGAQRLAYLASRLPSTYAVACRVLDEMKRRSADQEVHSLLDVGAGPGTALLAAMDADLPVTMATMIERDPGFISLGKQLSAEYGHVEQSWIQEDIAKSWRGGPCDLVTAFYSLNELPEKARASVLEKLWDLTLKFLIIIEPGTKNGFELLKTMRQSLLIKGAYPVAPCPHSEHCPIGENDWCHFYSRLERSSFHRKSKEATLNYEDEKFCYLIVSRKRLEPCQSRVLRHPFKGKGFVKLQLCSRNGIVQKTVTKSMKLEYAQAKKIEWGDGCDNV